MLMGAAGFGAMLVIGAVFYLGVVAPLIRGSMYLVLWDAGRTEQAELISLRRAFSIRSRYVVRYRYRVLHNNGTLKTFTRSEKIDRQLFAALQEFYQRHEPVPIRYLAEKPRVALLEMRMERDAAAFATLRATRSRRRRNPLRSYLPMVMFVILLILVNAYGSHINQFLSSLVP